MQAILDGFREGISCSGLIFLPGGRLGFVFSFLQGRDRSGNVFLGHRGGGSHYCSEPSGISEFVRSTGPLGHVFLRQTCFANMDWNFRVTLVFWACIFSMSCVLHHVSGLELDDASAAFRRAKRVSLQPQSKSLDSSWGMGRFRKLTSWIVCLCAFIIFNILCLVC